MGILLESRPDKKGIDRGCTEQADVLLTEIEQSLHHDEQTADPLSEKLANIANQRWLQRLCDDQLKDKFEKYNRPANCENLLSLKLTPKYGGNLTVSLG